VKPPNVLALEAKLGHALEQCPNCEGWFKAGNQCGDLRCERLAAHIAKHEGKAES
jgi:hypothetical protein